MSNRSLLAVAGTALALTLAFAPASRGEETLTLIERACAMVAGAQDSRAYSRCMEETARQMLISAGTRQPYTLEIISGEPLDSLADQLADGS